ncbi:hypothetical protein ACIBW9_18460 [Streptomyces sp. NPDC049541]|uniref:hypothetical protein n=1 Tax=Streptomyces sp. NPDC049541 TaxID=3365594 RepID=UPI003798BDCC
MGGRVEEFEVGLGVGDTTTGADGKTLTPQAEPGYNPVPTSAFDLDARSRMTCRSGQGKASAEIPVTFPVLLSAVDPEAEDRLVGLGDTVTSGRMLTSKDRPVWGPDPFDSGPAASRQHDYQVPVMLSSHALTSTTLTASVERLDAGDPGQLPGKLGSPAAHRFVTALRGKTVGTVGADLDKAFRSVDRAVNFDTGGYWTVGPVAYGVTADGLVARSRPQQPADVWKNNLEGTSALLSDVPEENAGTQYRTVADHASTNCGGHKTCSGEDSGRAPIPTLYEGLGLALLGSLTGAAAGLATVLALGEGVLSGHLLPVAAAAGTAILVSTGLVCAALAVPIRTLTRIAPVRVLAAD